MFALLLEAYLVVMTTQEAQTEIMYVETDITFSSCSLKQIHGFVLQ